MRTYYRFIVVLNFVFVLGYIADLEGLRWLLLLTSMILFVDGLSYHADSRMYLLFTVGALFNFMGAVSGTIIGIKPGLSMAVIGSILLLVAYLTDQPKRSTQSERN